jgi:hypothetical protein
VIIRFLYNEKSNAHDITSRLQAQFTQDVYVLETIQFWNGEIYRGRQDLHDENYMRRPPLDDIDTKILVIQNKSLIKSA